jgi:hypothetical protein
VWSQCENSVSGRVTGDTPRKKWNGSTNIVAAQDAGEPPRPGSGPHRGQSLPSSDSASGRYTSSEDSSRGTGGRGSMMRPGSRRCTPTGRGRSLGLCVGEEEAVSRSLCRSRLPVYCREAPPDGRPAVPAAGVAGEEPVTGGSISHSEERQCDHTSTGRARRKNISDDEPKPRTTSPFSDVTKQEALSDRLFIHPNECAHSHSCLSQTEVSYVMRTFAFN